MNLDNLHILRDIANQLDCLDEDDATKTEKDIAQILINAGLMTLVKQNCREIVWKEFRVNSTN